jgi:hypothetical protein
MNGRRLIFVPEINSSSFVFFYVMGERSYSVREYLHPPSPKLRYADEFPYTASEIGRMARRSGNHFFEAERHPTKDFKFWHQTIVSLNQSFLGSDEVAVLHGPDAAEVATTPAPEARYPIMKMAELMSLPKASKRQDLERILESPNSEDYVTWNVLQLLQHYGGEWWNSWLELARFKNPAAAVGLLPADRPEVKLWLTVHAPLAYEQASRRRMAASPIPDWVQRSAILDAVEGPSEIDVVLSGKHYLIYIEAKLGSDISLRTTYDPERNQVVRNIDCVIEGAGDRIPLFWMIARDDAPGRSYMQAIDTYKKDSATLATTLPHRNEAVLEDVASRITVFLWRELLAMIGKRPDDPDEQRILNEVRSRT